MIPSEIMMRYFSVANNGKSLLIKNISERVLTLFAVTVKYGVTVDTIDGKGIRNIGDDLRMNKTLGQGETVEVPLKLPDPVLLVVIFRDGEMVRREDISI